MQTQTERIAELEKEIADALQFCRLCTEVGLRKGDRLIDYISALHESARSARAELAKAFMT